MKVNHNISSESAQIPGSTLVEGYRAMVFGRALDTLATNLAKQGQLVVYPSSAGQEACQVGAVLELREGDWLFPTYRDSVALMTRGIDPVEVLTLFRGDWHSGYDSRRWRSAPHATPLATQLPHAVGVGMAERFYGNENVAVALCGDGATSEGDFHEALNLAAVYSAPVIFFIQNNGYAISVPRHKQTAAKSLAAKGSGYGVPAVQVDGNDLEQVLREVAVAVQRARKGDGPTLIEAITFRVGPHTNADNPDRYRSRIEVQQWTDRDPVNCLRDRLISIGLLDDDDDSKINDDARNIVREARVRLSKQSPPTSVDDLFQNVYRSLTPQLQEQRDQLNFEVNGER